MIYEWLLTKTRKPQIVSLAANYTLDGLRIEYTSVDPVGLDKILDTIYIDMAPIAVANPHTGEIQHNITGNFALSYSGKSTCLSTPEQIADPNNEYIYFRYEHNGAVVLWNTYTRRS